MGRAHLAMTEIGTYDHIDFRVRNLRKVSKFYDALMPALGLRVVVSASETTGTKTDGYLFSV